MLQLYIDTLSVELSLYVSYINNDTNNAMIDIIQIMNFQTIKSFILVLVFIVNILVIVHKEWLIREIYNWSGERRRAGQLHYE